MFVRLSGFIALLLLLGSCQTQEQIRREQMVDNLSMQMVQNQQLTADATVKLQNLQEQLNLLTGEVENKDYKMMMDIQDEFAGVKEQVELMKKQLESQQKEVDEVRSKTREQKQLLDNILKTLNDLSANKSKKKPLQRYYDKVMGDYGNARYKSAKEGLLNLEADSNIQGDQRARVLHNLGMIAYMDKEWDKAQGYFGRLLTDHPEASQVRNGLLFLGKSFKENNQKEEAKQILNELLRRYPKASQAGEAKKVIDTL